MDKEFDSSETAFEVYSVLYRNNLPLNYQVIEKGRRHIKDVFIYNNKQSQKIKLSGDTDFNYSEGFAHSRAEAFIKHLKDSPKGYDVTYTNNFSILQKLTCSVVNISLMPQTGCLQLVKEGLGNDRIDTYIWGIDEYYKHRSDLLFNRASYDNTEALKSFLSLFDDVYEYCDAMYHINESLVDDMIESGKTAIDGPEKMINFMNLTIRFWGQKSKYLYSIMEEYDNEIVRNELDSVNLLLNDLYTN